MTFKKVLLLATIMTVMLGAILAAAHAGQSEASYLPLIAAGDDIAPGCSVAIMLLGDSITAGYGSSQMVGYRRDLYHALDSVGYTVDFVGSHNGGFLTDFDRDHEGHPGERASFVRDNVDKFLEQNRPDIILLHIGTNNIWNQEPTAIATEIDQVLSAIYAYDSEIMVFLARIINRVDIPERVEKTSKLNRYIQQLADVRIRNGDRLAVVDMENALIYAISDDGQGDMADRAHPNDSGYRKMAIVWNAALQSFLQSHCNEEHAPRFTSAPPRQAAVNLPYSYRVQASGVPAPRFELVKFPPNMRINERTGEISWTPAGTGPTVVSVRATNGVKPDAEQNFEIQVDVENACPPDLVAYYHLDEASPPFADALGGAPAICSSCPTPVNGRISGALSFDGQDTSLNVQEGLNRINWGNNSNFSIEFWVQRPGACAGSTFDFNEVVVGRDDPGSEMIWWAGVSCANGGRVRFALRDSDSDNSDDVDIVSQSVIIGGVWHHVAVVRSSGGFDARLYVDGRREGVAFAQFSSGFMSDSAALNVGWLKRAGGFHLAGLVDELAVYTRTLTDSEIEQHYLAGKQGRPYCALENRLATID